MIGDLHHGAMHLRAYALRSSLPLGFLCYVFFSVLLLMLTGVDVRIPCLFKLLLGIPCLGCGMTRALQALLVLNFSAAFESNPLIFLVSPATAWFFVRDYKKTMLQRASAPSR